MLFYKKNWNKETFRVAAIFIGIYIIGLGLFFFFYPQASVAGQAVGYDWKFLGVISIWYVWIFTHNRVLLRNFLFKKRRVAYVSWLLAGTTLIAVLQSLLLKAESFPSVILRVAFFTLGGAILFFAILYLKERKNFYQMSLLKKEVELQQLKNQLNPHFLFNSLNNIYSYSLENNTYGVDLLLKLSQLMRFILESTSKNEISVGEEISFIDNYVLFEKERLEYRCDIVYVKEISYPEKSIAPLILFPFVENAFKHGTNSIDRSKIEISIKDSLNELSLQVSNAVKVNRSTSTKTGLSNIKRRLELLFPGRHQLIIADNNVIYSVNMKLKLE